jgi:hypothetical protein
MKKSSVGLLELETADLECFLEKTPLSPLGVKIVIQYLYKCLLKLPQSPMMLVSIPCYYMYFKLPFSTIHAFHSIHVL